MKRKLVVAVVTIVMGVVVFTTTYKLYSNSLEPKPMNAELLQELDDNRIENLTVSVNGEEVELENLTAPLGNVDCYVTLASGERLTTKGYVVAGDDYKAEFNDGVVKITVRR